MMKVTCLAKGCNNSSQKTPGLRFHRFPFNRPKVLKKWVRDGQLKRPPKKFSVLCDDHFNDDAYTNNLDNAKKRLKYTSEPTIFSGIDHSQQNLEEESDDQETPNMNEVLVECDPMKDVDSDQNRKTKKSNEKDKEIGKILEETRLTAAIVDGRITYSCQFCEFHTIDSAHMRSHLTTHAKDKPYECILCSFRCSVSINLKKHYLVHTTQKSFKVQANDLETCKQAKRYKCTECSFNCVKKDDLKKHMACHPDERSFFLVVQ